MEGQMSLAQTSSALAFPVDAMAISADMQSVSLCNLAILVCTAERFAQQSGLPLGVVHGHIKKGYLPVKRIGKYTLINLALFNQELLND